MVSFDLPFEDTLEKNDTENCNYPGVGQMKIVWLDSWLK